MKLLREIGKSILAIIAILACLFIYFDSDFYEVRRLQGQIEENLKIQLSELPNLIDREDYGWAEEGGDKALLSLSRQDCIVISSVMTDIDKFNKKSARFDLFSRNNIKPTYVKTWFKSNTHGDFINYALDEKTCNLYRRSHYE